MAKCYRLLELPIFGKQMYSAGYGSSFTFVQACDDPRVHRPSPRPLQRYVAVEQQAHSLRPWDSKTVRKKAEMRSFRMTAHWWNGWRCGNGAIA